jgi:anaerobic magnesium-protoporphyrin IX monomethyl ester cyclase
MRVLLINPPDELELMLGLGRAFIQNYEPLGILYIAAVLRDAGHQVEVIDAHAEGLDELAIRARIEASAPRVVGFTTLTSNGAMVYTLGRWLKRAHPEMIVVLGNVHASVYAQAYLANDAADVVVHGEGEWVMRRLLEHVDEGKRFADIPGISYRHGAEVRHCGTPGDGGVVGDLAGLPMPARDLVEQSRYTYSNISNQLYIARPGERVKTVMTSRGCPNRCSFCVVHGCKLPRFNSPERVVDELEALQRDYDMAYAFIQDPLFMANRRRVYAICDEIRRRQLRIRWGCSAHVNYVTPDLIRAMDRAGCYDVALGIESGVQRLLDSVHKRTRVARVVEAVDFVKANSGVLVAGLFILGIPGETTADSLQTLRFARSLDIDMAQFSVFTPYPGSPIYDDLAARGRIDTGVDPDGGVRPEVWRRYSSYLLFTDNEPIWTTPTQPVERLRALQKLAVSSFYLRPSQVRRQLGRVRLDTIGPMMKLVAEGFF